MLVLPTDSGYNSPCDGIAPSSLHSSPEKFLQPCINPEVRRKLRFESRTSWYSESYFTPPRTNRFREIGQRLVQICDSFDKEFTDFADETKVLTLAASIYRIIGF